MTFPERAAERLLDELNIRDLSELYLLEEIAFARGAVVMDKALTGMEARLTAVRNQAVITLSTSINHRQRRRFSIAHELGHLELHPRVSSYALCTQADINEGEHGKQGNVRESEANLFAAALLLPQRFLASMCQAADPSVDLISHLAQVFDTSLTATGLRYVQFCEEPVAWVFSQDGKVQWFRGSPAFAELNLYLEVKGKLDPSTLASRYFRDGSLPSGQQRLPIWTWIEPGWYRQEATILEQSRAIPALQGVLTLLWVDDEIGEDTYYDWEES